MKVTQRNNPGFFFPPSPPSPLFIFPSLKFTVIYRANDVVWYKFKNAVEFQETEKAKWFIFQGNFFEIPRFTSLTSFAVCIPHLEIIGEGVTNQLPASQLLLFLS